MSDRLSRSDGAHSLRRRDYLAGDHLGYRHFGWIGRDTRMVDTRVEGGRPQALLATGLQHLQGSEYDYWHSQIEELTIGLQL